MDGATTQATTQAMDGATTQATTQARAAGRLWTLRGHLGAAGWHARRGQAAGAAAPKRVIVISGVTSGLGRALAVHFMQHGHTVLGCGRRKAAIAELASGSPSHCRFTPVDTTDPAQVERWATSVRDLPIDLLINNAGVAAPALVPWELDAAVFSNLIDVNVNGVHNMVRSFVPGMVARRKGVIVNFSSGASPSHLAPTSTSTSTHTHTPGCLPQPCAGARRTTFRRRRAAGSGCYCAAPTPAPAAGGGGGR